MAKDSKEAAAKRYAAPSEKSAQASMDKTTNEGQGSGGDDRATRHSRERTDAHERHSIERSDMFKRHESEFKSMSERHLAEMMDTPKSDSMGGTNG